MTTATATKIAVGQKVEFTGYTSLAPGQDEILVPGQSYTVSRLNDDGGIVVVDSAGRGDTVFDDEIRVIEAKAKPAKATKVAKPAAKAKAAPKAKTATKAKAPAKVKATKTTKVTTKAGDIDVDLTKLAVDPSVHAGGIVETPTITALVAPLTDSESVEKILASNDMLTAARALAVAAEETFLNLGGVLQHIYATGAHKSLGYDGKRGFADYMLKELNIQYRKGMYLIEIYGVARRLGLDEATIAQIGWSKMKEIANKLDAENSAELLEYAKDHTRDELVAHVRKTYVKPGEDTGERVMKTRLSFSLFGDQAGTVERALAAASSQISNPTPENALVLIASEWSQFTESVELSAFEALTALVERFGADAVRTELGRIDSESQNDNEVDSQLVTA